jgi:hypothetical protein
MPEGIPYASTNVIAGVGKDLNYIGNRVYAYSGYVGFNNSAAVTFLEFTTGSEYIVCTAQYTVMDDGEQINEDDVRVVIKLNEVKAFVNIDSGSPNRVQTAWPELILPPYTKLQATMLNLTDASALAGYFCLVGKVYK